MATGFDSGATLLDLFVDDMSRLGTAGTHDACQMILCAHELQIDSPLIRVRVDRLLADEPDPSAENESFAESAIRQMVFSILGVGRISRQRFLEYWFGQKHFRGKDVVSISYLVNIAFENMDLLDRETQEYVRSWHVVHPDIQSDRVAAWSVNCLARSGHLDLAKQRCDSVLARRGRNGSWNSDIRLTVACAFALAVSGLVDGGELNGTLPYVLSRCGRGVPYDIATRTITLKLLWRLGKLPKADYQRTKSRIENPGSIFLSHSSSDKPFVRRLSTNLQRCGIRTWIDEAEILPGDSFIERIESGIEEMQYLGVILSPRSVASAWVMKELRVAMATSLPARTIKVIPILLEDCKVPLSLSDLNYADFRSDYDAGLERLLQRLCPILPEAGP